MIVCRHTFCSKMAKSGMNPKTLQRITGHSGIAVTTAVFKELSEMIKILFICHGSQLDKGAGFCKVGHSTAKYGGKPCKYYFFYY